MKVILNQDVYNLGEEGDICDVKRGYARNYLLPKDLAFPFTKQYKSFFDNRKEAITQRKEQKRKEAGSLRERLESIEFNFAMPAGDTGKLFGAVTNLTISEELAKEGFSIERKKIEVPQHAIKMVGNFTIKIKLYEGETAIIKIGITKSDDGKKKAGSKKKSAIDDNKAELVKADETAEVKAAEEAIEEKVEEKAAEEAVEEKAEVKEEEAEAAEEAIEEKAEVKEEEAEAAEEAVEEKAEEKEEEAEAAEEAIEEKAEVKEEAEDKTQAVEPEALDADTEEESGEAEKEEAGE